MTVPTGSRRVAPAVEFIHFATGPGGQRIYTGMCGHLPSLRELVDDLSMFPTEQRSFMRSLLPYTMARPVLPVAALHWATLTGAFDRLLLQAITPAELARQVENEVNPELARFR